LEFFKTMKVDAVPKGRGRSGFAGTTKVAIYLVDGQFYAIKNFCPHAGAALAVGRMDGPVVECSRHQWKFNVQTGACLTNGMFTVQNYPTKVEDGYVWVGIGPG
jgi:3-phenylpropionate/trans-cinnamate dioxygenase ferredoxin subunit